MEEQTRLAKEQVESLLEDRRIKTEEAQAQWQRDQERITALTDKWVCFFFFFFFNSFTTTLLLTAEYCEQWIVTYFFFFLELYSSALNDYEYIFHLISMYDSHFLLRLTSQARANPEPFV